MHHSHWCCQQTEFSISYWKLFLRPFILWAISEIFFDCYIYAPFSLYTEIKELFILKFKVGGKTTSFAIKSAVKFFFPRCTHKTKTTKKVVLLTVWWLWVALCWLLVSPSDKCNIQVHSIEHFLWLTWSQGAILPDNICFVGISSVLGIWGAPIGEG